MMLNKEKTNKQELLGELDLDFRIYKSYFKKEL